VPCLPDQKVEALLSGLALQLDRGEAKRIVAAGHRTVLVDGAAGLVLDERAWSRPVLAGHAQLGDRKPGPFPLSLIAVAVEEFDGADAEMAAQPQHVHRCDDDVGAMAALVPAGNPLVAGEREHVALLELHRQHGTAVLAAHPVEDVEPLFALPAAPGLLGGNARLVLGRNRSVRIILTVRLVGHSLSPARPPSSRH